MLKYTFSAVCVLVSILSPAHAQELRRSDTVKYKYVPTGLRLATDVLSLIRTQANGNFSGWEVNADIDFARYYLNMDYGSWASDYELKNGTYTSDGTYFRIGPDVNFLLKDPDRNMLFLGFRYGRSNYSDRVVMTYEDANFGSVSRTLVNPSLTGGWGELTGGLRVKVWKWLWMGYTARFKFAAKAKGYGELRPYDLPGYGLLSRSNYWGFNYQVFVRLPFRKQRPDPPKVILKR